MVWDHGAEISKFSSPTILGGSMKKNTFQKCIDHIRKLDKKGLKKLKKESDTIFGKDTKIVVK